MDTREQALSTTNSEAVINDMKEIIATHDPADKYKYMLLSRMMMDCKYFLGPGNRYQPQLWAGHAETHIQCMLLLYDSFPEDKRPEWLTREQIEDYGRDMLNDNQKRDKVLTELTVK